MVKPAYKLQTGARVNAALLTNVELSIVEISVIGFVVDYIIFCESQRIGSILEQVFSLNVYLSTLMDC